MVARGFGRSFGAEAGTAAGAAAAGGIGFATAGASPDAAFCASSNGQISPGWGGDGRVRGGGCQAGWRRAETASMPRCRTAGCAVPALPVQRTDAAPPKPRAVGFRTSSCGSSRGSAGVSGDASSVRLRVTSWRHERPNTIGATQISTPSISTNAPVHPSSCENTEDNARPTAPPALSCGSAPDVSASSAALAHSTTSVTSQSLTVPRPLSTWRSPASMRTAYRHASGSSHTVEMPNQPSPMSNAIYKCQAAIVAGRAAAMRNGPAEKHWPGERRCNTASPIWALRWQTAWSTPCTPSCARSPCR